MPEAKPSYFITTHITSTQKPHLGTAYCTLLCDIQARFRRAAGYMMFFSSLVWTSMARRSLLLQLIMACLHRHGVIPRFLFSRDFMKTQHLI